MNTEIMQISLASGKLQNNYIGGQLTSLNILIHISVPSLENYMNMDTQMSLRSSGNTALLGCTCHAGNIEK